MIDQQKQIEAEGNNYTAGLDERFRDGANDAYIAGATKYAALLAEKDKEIEELKAEVEEYRKKFFEAIKSERA